MNTCALQVPGDGHCFFRAVRGQMKLEDIKTVKQCRKLIATYIRQHKEELKEFICKVRALLLSTYSIHSGIENIIRRTWMSTAKALKRTCGAARQVFI